MRKALTLAALVLVLVLALAPAAAEASASCGTPAGSWERRSPSELGLRADRLQDALDWATLHTSFSVAVYRHGCLAAESRLDPLTADQQLDGWSMTKTVTALLVGRAVTQRRLKLDRPIRRLYPEADSAHGSLTPRQLLTMTSGLHLNWVRDLTVGGDRIRDALSLPFDYQPGTHWEYQQSPVTLLANVVERAVGQDLQDFAQEQLFDPIGIRRGTWSWQRDRAGHTEGWAHLSMRNADWARLGHLVLRRGRWGRGQLISRKYVRQMLRPSRRNNAYGFLTWLNGRGRWVLPAVSGTDEGTGRVVPAAPWDLVFFAGLMEQRIYVIPSRDMVIVRLGVNGSREGDTRVSLWAGRGGELDHELMRRFMGAVEDVPYTDPGPYRGSDLFFPPLDRGLVADALDLEQVLAGLGN
jgi:CubicO group peptidase (beta-lactamase class C family)